jgi:hypothetical protein
MLKNRPSTSRLWGSKSPKILQHVDYVQNMLNMFKAFEGIQFHIKVTENAEVNEQRESEVKNIGQPGLD